MRYIALLRGINVGGNRRVPMSELVSIFKQLGYQEVSTYINSGNVIFASERAPDSSVIESKLAQHFGFDIDTMVLSATEVVAISEMIPNDWTNDAPNPEKIGQKSDVLYLFDDVDDESIIAKIGYRSEVETMIYTPRAVLVNVTRKNQSRSSLQKLAGTPLYKRMTIRNITTAKKLAELVKAES